LLSSGRKKASFKEILSEDTKEEKITKFIHLLHLESENKIRCTQREFLGDIEIELTSK
jgi:chromatin segregation and condensation protein Rec8/ScpA/Scc1 (kleisin family)